MPHLQPLTRAIGWIVVAAFAITFTVTILALIGVLRIEKEYLNRLFFTIIVELISSGFFLFKQLFNQPTSAPASESSAVANAEYKDYVGRIDWHLEYAETLFNYNKGTSNFLPVHPRSEGHLHFYKASCGVIKGFSTWETRNGELTYSRLAVIPSEFEFDKSGRLRKLSMNIAFREKLREFSYGPYTHYHLIFNEWTDTRIRGKIFLAQNGNGKEKVVGDVVLERV